MQQHEFYPEFSFPLINFLSNGIVQFILILCGEIMTFSKQMIISLVMIIICLVSLPFVVYFIPGLTGFLITCLIIFSQGVACASINNCLFRVSGSLPEKYIIALSSGQSLSGIIMCVIRYIIIALFQEREDDIILNS